MTVSGKLLEVSAICRACPIDCQGSTLIQVGERRSAASFLHFWEVAFWTRSRT